MEDSRNIIKAIDALTLKAGGEAVDSKNITEAIDNLKAVYDQEAIGLDDTLTQEGLAADAKAVGDAIKSRDYSNTCKFRNVGFLYNGTANNIGARCAEAWEYIVTTLKSISGWASGDMFVSFEGYIMLPSYNGSTNLGCCYIDGMINVNNSCGTIHATHYSTDESEYMLKNNELPVNVVVYELPKRSEMNTVLTRSNAFGIIPSFASNNVGANKELVVTFSVAGSASNYRGAMLLMTQENLNYGAPSLVMFSWGSDRSNPVVVNKIVGSETVYDDAYIDADTKTLHIPISNYSSIMAFTIANALSGSTIALKTKS